MFCCEDRVGLSRHLMPRYHACVADQEVCATVSRCDKFVITMKRRQAIQALLSAPAIAAIPISATAQELPKLVTSTADSIGEAATGYFSSSQMAALRRLADLIVPSSSGRPGAVDAKAAEFLDFLLSQSPEDRQSLYGG